MCVYMYECMYVCTHTYTLTHTHTRSHTYTRTRTLTQAHDDDNKDKSKSDHTEKKATHEKPTVHSLQHQGLMQTTKALKKTVHEFKHAHGAEKKKLKVCVYVLYMCMYVCVRACLCV